LESLGAPEKKGVRLIVCSTCVNYYGLADIGNIGIVRAIIDIFKAQNRAGKVIKLYAQKCPPKNLTGNRLEQNPVHCF